MPPASAREVFLAFLKLGLLSFGGPIAHLGYFRAEFVGRRRWLDDEHWSDLVALCQFLPGPTSSQVGVALGLRRAGWPGAAAAWLGFTLPSAMAMALFAFGVARWNAAAIAGPVHGLKLAAVAVVAQAVWGMAKSLCPDAPRAALAVAAALLALALPGVAGQLAAIALGGLAGRLLLAPGPLPAPQPQTHGVGRRQGALLLLAFAVLLAALPAAAALTASASLAAISAFYRAGALVFGGGHVVLPLLQAAVVPPGWIDADRFLAGYGAAQAVPGPLFTFAAYLGAAMPGLDGWLGGWVGAIALLLAIFAPAVLLVAGALPFWDVWRSRRGMRRALGGINAAVVGVLAAALIDPVGRSALLAPADAVLALAAFALLLWGRVPPVAVVAGLALAGWAMA